MLQRCIKECSHHSHSLRAKRANESGRVVLFGDDIFMLT